MLPALPFQLISLTADLAMLFFIGYYFLNLRVKEKELDKKEGKIDTEYHRVVDDALTKERTILDDASKEAGQILEQTTTEADKIIAGTQCISRETKDAVNQALKRMVADIEKEAVDTAHSFINSYSVSLEQVVSQSLSNFKNITNGFESDHQKQIADFQKILNQSLTGFQYSAKGLEVDLQKEIKDFHDTLLPNLEKELEEYKKARMKQAEQMITRVVQNVSQEILNKSISLEDHQKLVIESLEKAKKEGVFA